MWGNVQGWLFSVCLAAVAAVPLWRASRPPEPSQPSGTFSSLLAPVALPLDVKGVAPETLADSCDAGELYRQAIEEYASNPQLYAGYLEKPRTALAARPAVVELLVRASRCNRATLFARTPAELLSYQPETPALKAVEKLGLLVNQLGLLHRLDKNPREARRHFEAMFALGYHLYAERIAWAEFTAGVNLMTDAARGLAKVETDENNAERARSLEHFADAVDEYKLKQFEVYKVVSSIHTDTVGRHGGDILALARGSPETMWRGEAILALGRMKYNTSRRGDQLAAARELQQWTTDPNPAIRAAANTAASLTQEQYRAIRVVSAEQ